ncbi:1234_t:CDS:1, partial [Gigaspora margarita]
MGRIHKIYYSANARYLSDKAIKDIKTSFGRVPDAINTMAKKYRISVSRAKEYIENREHKQQILDLNRHCSTGPLE